MGSALSRAGILIRDEGETAYPGKVYEKHEKGPDGTVIHKKGDLVVDPMTMAPVDPPRPARNRWPAHTGIYVKPRLFGEDIGLMNRLGRRSDALMQEVKADDLDSLHNDLEGLMPVAIQLAVMLRRLECPIKTREQCQTDQEFEDANFFEDPRERPDFKDWDNDGTTGTGKVLAVPDDIVDRVKTVLLLPFEVITWASAEVSKMAENPLPGTRAVA